MNNQYSQRRNCKSIAINKQLFWLMLSFLAVVFVLSSCTKKDDELFDLSKSVTPNMYPYTISYTNVTAASTSVKVYTFNYDMNFNLISIANRMNTATRDTIFSTVVLGDKGIQKLGTITSPNSFVVQYDASGNVATVAMSYPVSGVFVTDTRNFTIDNGKISKSDKFIANAAIASYTNTFVYDENGNITSGDVHNFIFADNIYNNGIATLPNANTFTYYDSSLPNPFYGLAKNAAFSFLPEQLWTNIELIVFSKGLLHEYFAPNAPKITYTYQFDALNRIVLVTATSTGLTQTWSIAYVN